MNSHPLQCTQANRVSSRHGGQSITHPNYYSAQSVEKRATILGIRLKISTIEVQEQRSDADSVSDLAQMMSSRRKTPEGTNKEQRMVPQIKDHSDSRRAECRNTVTKGGCETLKVR